jgi:large subunit ribosomal protein L32e
MELLKIKNQLRKRRPRFIRSGAQHIKRISRSGYRRATGLHNKMKDNKKGRRSQIQTGFGFPKALRGTTTQGLKIVTVSSQTELEAVNPKEHAVVLKASLGLKKKLPLMQACVAKKITVIGHTDLSKKVSAIEKVRSELTKSAKSRQATRKQNQEALRKASEGKVDKKAKKADAKAAESEASDVDEKLAEEKKEKDKVLTQKQ